MYRKATFDDCNGVYRLLCDLECRELPRQRFAQIFKAQVENENYYCLVCEWEDKIVGALNLRFEEQLHHAERIAEVLEFSVDASCRSRGIGKEMFAKACEIAKAFGCSQIELSTNQLRKDAHRFYSREGMNNFHYKFSKPLNGAVITENAIGN